MVSMSSQGESFPVEQVDLGRAAIIVDRYMDATTPLITHTPLPLPPTDTTGRVVILVDGIGSSSVGLATREANDWLSDDGFHTCIFSYRGLDSRFYQPQDTVRNLSELAYLLDEYVVYYSSAESVVVVGYSFGGLVVAQWLFDRGASIVELENFDGTCLVASPIRLRMSNIHYLQDTTRHVQARERVGDILSGYTAIPEQLPLIAPLELIRSVEDGLLHDSVYTFQDRPLEDRPKSEHPLPFSHFEIIARPELKKPLLESVRAFCEGRDPDLLMAN